VQACRVIDPANGLRRRIDTMLDGGRPLARIEADVIERSALTEEQRAALWLYAWGCQQRDGERGRGVPYTPSG
jgi:hypothetical protein